MKKEKVPKIYKETPEERKERVRNEGNAYRTRVEKMRTTYDRNNSKKDIIKKIKEEDIER